MGWLQLKLVTTADDAERLSDLLSELGAASVTFLDAADQPLFEPLPGETPLWQQTLVIGLFSADINTESFIGSLQQQWGKNPLPPCRWEPLEDQDWVRAWLQHFKPMSFGDRLWIVPSGYTPPDPEAVNIELDPGLAFGTGTHPTTAMCLNWLDAHAPTGKRVIDYGCGSGILAIAAALLGAERVDAVDIDPQALIATQDNAQKNHVTGRIHTYLPKDLPDQPVELVLANILAGPLQTLANDFAALVQPSGQLILAGLLASQADEIIRHYAPWFDLQVAQQVEEWVCLAGIRHDTTAPVRSQA